MSLYIQDHLTLYNKNVIINIMEIDINGVKITLTKEQLEEIARQTQKVSKKEEMEKEFLNLWNGCTLKFDFEKYSQSIFLMKDGKYFFEQDFKRNYLWCSYNNVWSIFESKYGLEYNEIQSFIRDMVEQHFKLGGLTPYLQK